MPLRFPPLVGTGLLALGLLATGSARALDGRPAVDRDTLQATSAAASTRW